jgi:hypothetical protein
MVAPQLAARHGPATTAVVGLSPPSDTWGSSLWGHKPRDRWAPASEATRFRVNTLRSVAPGNAVWTSSTALIDQFGKGAGLR